MSDEIREAIINLLESADNEGCTDDLTVVSAEAVDALGALLDTR